MEEELTNEEMDFILEYGDSMLRAVCGWMPPRCHRILNNLESKNIVEVLYRTDVTGGRYRASFTDKGRAWFALVGSS